MYFFQSNEWLEAAIKKAIGFTHQLFWKLCVRVWILFGWVGVGGWLGVIINSVHAAEAPAARAIQRESVCFYPTTRLPENSLEEGGNDEVSSWSLAERGYKLLPACDVHAARPERTIRPARPTEWAPRARYPRHSTTGPAFGGEISHQLCGLGRKLPRQSLFTPRSRTKYVGVGNKVTSQFCPS